ncbi:hypothetical protein DRO29_06745, partial [Candidatus Bathyarchaeota archaeon]
MVGIDLWERYCKFYEKDFSEQMEFNRERMERYFRRWRKTDLAKMLCRGNIKSFRDVPITRYDDYPMLSEFGRKISEATKRNPKRKGELFKEYYDRISRKIGASLDRYMTEPLYLCMKTTGTTGESKWIAHGETFWKNFVSGAISVAVIACSDGWGETKAKIGDKALNLTAPVPHLSGWASWASQIHFKLIPPIEVTDNLRDMKETFFLILKAIRRGEKISLAG